MGVEDRHIDKNAKVAQRTIAFAVDDVGAGVADGLRGSFVPGYAYEIVGVQHFFRSVTAVCSYMVKNGTTAALSAAAVPVTATRADASLHAALANRRGTKTDAINLHLTTDGGGAAEEGTVYVTIRPRGLAHGG